jgi:hypothetical protein
MDAASESTAAWTPRIHSSGGDTFTTLPTHEQISRRAYEIYVRNGCREGQTEQNWLQAERELLTEAVKVTAAAGSEDEADAGLPQNRRLAPNFRAPRLRLTRSSW